MTNFKPNRWVSAALSLFVSPMGLLYVQRPKLAAAYFLAVSGLLGISFLGMIFSGVFNEWIFVGVSWSVAVICTIHTYRIASVAGPSPSRRWYSRWYGLISIPVVVWAVVFVFRSFFYEPFRTPSMSMYPTAPEGSYFIARKYGFGNYGTNGVTLLKTDVEPDAVRGDIVVHRIPGDPKTNYLRRIVAVPGDRIEYRNKRLWLNGVAVPTTLGPSDGNYQYAVERIDGRPITIALIPSLPPKDYSATVPAGHYVMFGDCRDNAKDSRYIGMIPKQELVGKVLWILPPRNSH